MKQNNPLKSIGGVMIIMLIGKLLSLIANQAYLSYFGADNERLNIFSWVLQIPNYLFQSFGTALSSVVIPLFAVLNENGKPTQANRFGSNIICCASVFTLLLIGIGWALSGFLVGFTEFEDQGYAVFCLRLLTPVMLFYALTNILQGILQSLKRFISPALTNLPSGIVILLYLLFFADRYGVTGLLIAVILGLFLQFAILVWPAHRAGFRFRPLLDLKDPSIRQAGRMTVPIVLGASAYQFNMFFNNTMVSNVSPESVTLFNFVQTLILSTVLTLIMAITSVMYPTMTSAYVHGDREGFRTALTDTIGGMVFILLPLTVGMICLRYPMMNLVSLHGKVSAQNIDTEVGFLLMYSPAIVFLGVKEIVDRAFYSMQTTKTSAIAGVIIMLINIAVGYCLSKFTPLRAYGIPLAYSIAIIAGTCFLILRLNRRIGGYGDRLAKSIAQSLVCSAVMAVCVVLIRRLLEGMTGAESILGRLILFVLPVLTGIGVYFAAAFLIHAQPLALLAAALTGKGGRHESSLSD